MFGTIIVDAYEEHEKIDISKSIDDLCSPNDNYGWSSAGIYCYWNFYTNEILYIGLARDLKTRFDQHNGLREVKDSSSKIIQINEYFKNNQKLGFSMFLQSTCNQVNSFRNKKRHIDDELSWDYEEDLKDCEGILLQAYKLNNNNLLPKWNKIGGDISGSKRAKPGNFEIIKGFIAINQFHPLTAKKTLREISNSSTYERYESCFFHSVRELMLFLGCSFNEGVEICSKQSVDNEKLLIRIKKEKYLYDFVKINKMDIKGIRLNFV